MSDFRVIGLDVSLTCTGVARVDGRTYPIAPKGVLGAERLYFIWQRIRALIEADQPDMAAIEELPPSGAHGTAALGPVHGVVRTALFARSVPFILVPPTSLKLFATGSGKADKAMMLKAGWQRLGYDGTSHDEVDALWLRMFGLFKLGERPIELPKTHLAALAKVPMPRPGDRGKQSVTL